MCISLQANATEHYIWESQIILQGVYEHQEKLVEGFPKPYKVFMLVYYEIHGNIEAAILREKQLKKWNRAWKLRLIEKHNPDWIQSLP